MIATTILFALVVIATITDLWRHQIYNWTTYTGILAALALSGAATVLDRSDIASVEFTQSLLGFLICGTVMMICFVLFQIGGGDVKLLAMTGAFLGPEFGIETLLWTFVLGGAVGVIILVWKLGAINLGFRVLQQLMSRLQLGNWEPLTDEEKTSLQLPLYLAPCALAAVLIVRFSILDALIPARERPTRTQDF